jgi:hypothetical protein
MTNKKQTKPRLTLREKQKAHDIHSMYRNLDRIYKLMNILRNPDTNVRVEVIHGNKEPNGPSTIVHSDITAFIRNHVDLEETLHKGLIGLLVEEQEYQEQQLKLTLDIKIEDKKKDKEISKKFYYHYKTWDEDYKDHTKNTIVYQTPCLYKSTKTKKLNIGSNYCNTCPEFYEQNNEEHWIRCHMIHKAAPLTGVM